jgi:surface antigen
VKVFAQASRQAYRQLLYNLRASFRLCGRRAFAVAAVMLGALCCGACSFPLSSLMPSQGAAPDVTGSVTPVAAHPLAHPSTQAPLSTLDLAYARAAAANALARGGDRNSVPWRNPLTGVGGSITPLASSHIEGGLPCRDFLATYGQGATYGWLQGSGCRTKRGAWEVTSLKPLNSS